MFPARPPHPAVYLALIIPFGAISGFTNVALGHLATKYGLSETDAAAIIAIGMAPHAWKFLWAPVADITLGRKNWYLLSVAASIIGVVGMSAIPLSPATLTSVQAMVFIASLSTTFLGMSVEGMIAHLTPESERGRTGGWFQAGNLGGNGIGGGLGLWLMTHLPAPWMSGAVMGGLFALCAAALTLVPAVPADASEKGIIGAVQDVVLDLWGMITSKPGLFAAILCFVPISTGAASGVLAQASVAAHWGAGETEVGLVNGLLAGFIMAGGSFVGGEICARYRARNVYAAVGAAMAAVALAMALAPTTPMAFILGGLVYSFGIGLAYAAFTGFVLEVIGEKGAATKYNIFASLSNMPITYMGLVLAWSLKPYGPEGMLILEAIAGVAGILVLLIAAQFLVRGSESQPATT